MFVEKFNLADRLHTDVLTKRYGQITASVLRQNARFREAHLIDTKSISRTYALTFFQKSGFESEIATVHEKIRKGGMIGEEFKNAGFSVRKNVVHVFTLRIPQWLKKAFKTRKDWAKARISELYAGGRKGSEPQVYATVVEVYPPGFRRAKVKSVDLKQVKPFTSVLKLFGIGRQQVWERLGRKNCWHDGKKLREKALKASKGKVAKIKARLDSILAAKK